MVDRDRQVDPFRNGDTSVFSPREIQIQRIKEMIDPQGGLLRQPDDWRFLICDSIGEDIITPLFTHIDLENLGATLHLLINSRRDPVPDLVAAVYFVMPSDENIERICRDLEENLYERYNLNFISSISRDKLITLAEAAKQSKSELSVERVYDHHFDFISLEEDFFILRQSGNELVSFQAINRSDVSDDQITVTINLIVDSLLSLILTLNYIPIIRFPKGGPAEAVAKELGKKISLLLKDEKSELLKGKRQPSSDRILLCLLDRAVDMSTPLHHTWTYQALVHDLLNLELNQVKVSEDGDQPKTHIYDLKPTDKFWLNQKGKPFPQVAEAVQQEFDNFRKQKEDDEDGLKSVMGPERAIKDHTIIATAVLNEIKTRKLDNFFEIEEKLMNRSPIDRVTLDEMLTTPDYGSPSDKLRLLMISYICDNPKFTDQEIEKYVEILEGLGCGRPAFEYLKRWKAFSQTNVACLQSSLQSSGGLSKTAGMFTKLMSKGSQFVMEGVKNLVLKEHYLPVTKIVDGLMDCSSKMSREAFEYGYLDPTTSIDEPVRRKVFQKSIVFMVGGGNYIEYQNISDYCETKNRAAFGAAGSRHVIYGATDLMNASQFLQQLEFLGHQ